MDNTYISAAELKNNPLNISSLIVLTLALVAAMPFSHLFLLHLGVVTLNPYELAYAVIFVLLITHLIFYGVNKRFSLTLLLTVSIFIIYGFVSVLIYKTSLDDVFKQIRFYIPFFLATLIVASKISYDVVKFTRYLTFAALVSSLSAIVLNFAFPQVIASMYQTSETAAYISTEGGRLRWDNSFLLFFVIAIYFSSRHKSVVLYLSLISCLVALMASVSRTEILATIVFVIVLSVFEASGVIKKLKRVSLLLPIILIALLAAYFVLSLDSRFTDAANIRFTGGGDVSNIYERSVEINRLFLYDQYWTKLSDNFPFGQGLGRPFANNGIEDVFISDISIVSFMLPFGLVGAVLFFIFVRAIRQLFRKPTHSCESLFEKKFRYAFLHMTTIWILISLNDDWFSRKSSVIYLALFGVLIFSTKNRKLMDS